MSFSGAAKSADIVLSNGYLTAGKSGGSGSWRGVLGSAPMPNSGKSYFELRIATLSGLTWFGIGTAAAALNASPATGGAGTAYVYSSDGYRGDGSTATSYGSTYSTGDVIGIAYDPVAGSLWFAKNNTWQASGNPATGASPAFTGITGELFPLASLSGTAGAITVDIFDSGNQTYAPPSGFTAVNVPPFVNASTERRAVFGNSMTAAAQAMAVAIGMRL